jgi:hypothetical protein
LKVPECSLLRSGFSPDGALPLAGGAVGNPALQRKFRRRYMRKPDLRLFAAAGNPARRNQSRRNSAQRNRRDATQREGMKTA